MFTNLPSCEILTYVLDVSKIFTLILDVSKIFTCILNVNTKQSVHLHLEKEGRKLTDTHLTGNNIKSSLAFWYILVKKSAELILVKNVHDFKKKKQA